MPWLSYFRMFLCQSYSCLLFLRYLFKHFLKLICSNYSFLLLHWRKLRLIFLTWMYYLLFEDEFLLFIHRLNFSFDFFKCVIHFSILLVLLFWGFLCTIFLSYLIFEWVIPKLMLCFSVKWVVELYYGL